MRNDRVFFSFFQILTFVFLLMLSQTVYAEGKMVLKSSLDTGVSYEENYFSSQENERSVFSYHVKPGVEVGYTTAKTNLLFNYVMDANWYDEEDTPPAGELSIDEYNYVGHDLELTADTQVTDRLNVSIEDSYFLTRDSDRLDPYSNEVNKHKYSKNSFKPELYYQFGEKFGFGAGFTRTDIDYNNDADEDSQENRGALNLHYNMSSLNSLDLQYQYWKKDYDETTPDYTSQQVMLTFSRALKYYTLEFGGGYQDRSFDNSLKDDMGGFVWAMSIFGDRPQMRFSISQNYNDTAVDDYYYLATRFSAAVGHRFLKKLNLKLQGYYQKSDYQGNTVDREDDTWVVSCKFDYLRNEIFSINIEPGFETRDSSVSGHDYDNSYILLGMKLNFNLGSK